MRFVRVGALVFACLLLCNVLSAQDDKMVYASAATAKLGNLPVLPSCMTVTAAHGDYTKGPSTIIAKFTSGCTVPWHWHTANENIILTAGKGKVEMKDGASHAMSAGDYAYLPGKQAHQFTCTVSCTMYDLPDGAFDIHYIDKDGKEIAPDQALKAGAKAAGAKAGAKAAHKK